MRLSSNRVIVMTCWSMEITWPLLPGKPIRIDSAISAFKGRFELWYAIDLLSHQHTISMISFGILILWQIQAALFHLQSAGFKWDDSSYILPSLDILTGSFLEYSATGNVSKSNATPSPLTTIAQWYSKQDWAINPASTVHKTAPIRLWGHGY